MGELPFWRVDTTSPIGFGQKMHFCRRHPETHLPEPLRPRSGRGESSRRRIRAAKRAAGAGCPAATLHRSPVCALAAGPSRRSHRTMPLRIGRAQNPGAGFRGRTLLRIGHLGGRTCGRQSWFAGAPAGQRAGPSPRSPVSHWFPAVSLGTWRRRLLRPLSGWARGHGESLWIERRGAEVAGGPLDR